MRAEVLILGAGPAGLSAAKAACRQRKDVVLAGEEPYLPYWRPRLSEILTGGGQMESIRMYGEDWFAQNGVKCLTSHRAVTVEPAQKTVQWGDGSTTEYGTLILSCGALPQIPEIPFAEQVCTLRSYDDALEIRRQCEQTKKAFIVGGGVLGLETASALAKLGCSVAVSVHSYPLSRQLDQEGGQFLDAILGKEGITVCCGKPADFKAEMDGACVIAATGVRPDMALAKACGIETDRGILVDEKMRTNVPDIYACGDVAEYQGAIPGLMAIATRQGEVAGVNASGGDAVYCPVLPSPLMKVAGISVLSIGSMKSVPGARTYRRISGDRYAAAVVAGNSVVGAAFIGEIAMGTKFKSWMERGGTIADASSFEDIEKAVLSTR